MKRVHASRPWCLSTAARLYKSAQSWSRVPAHAPTLQTCAATLAIPENMFSPFFPFAAALHLRAAALDINLKTYF